MSTLCGEQVRRVMPVCALIIRQRHVVHLNNGGRLPELCSVVWWWWIGRSGIHIREICSKRITASSLLGFDVLSNRFGDFTTWPKDRAFNRSASILRSWCLEKLCGASYQSNTGKFVHQIQACTYLGRDSDVGCLWHACAIKWFWVGVSCRVSGVSNTIFGVIKILWNPIWKRIDATAG